MQVVCENVFYDVIIYTIQSNRFDSDTDGLVELSSSQNNSHDDSLLNLASPVPSRIDDAQLSPQSSRSIVAIILMLYLNGIPQ